MLVLVFRRFKNLKELNKQEQKSTMFLYTTCKNCKTELKFWSNNYTRVELAKNEGEFKKLICKNCTNQNKVHVDDIHAQNSKFLKYFGLMILAFGTPFSFYVLYLFLQKGNLHGFSGLVLVIAIPVFIYIIIKKEERMRINTFNRGKLKGRVHNISKTKSLFD